ncbi:pantetheine-phosphate adenylyltransferase [Halocola ammonii]
MKRIAVFPGSFDPITKGHEDVVLRAKDLFDEIVVAVGQNSSKSSMFPLEKRTQWIEDTFKDYAHIRTETYTGLTIEYCKSIGAQFLLRGIRNTNDFNYEQSIAQMNRSLNRDVETILLFTAPELSAINSTIVRDIVKNNGDVAQFLPEGINVYE